MFVNQFIWNKIRCLAETVAALIVLKKQQMAGSIPAGQLERPAKRIKTLELLLAALDIVADDDNKDVNGSGKCFKMAAQMVNAEVQILKGIGDETNIELWPESTKLCKWWARQTNMPCLMQAALAIMANKPSSGGLECDLGSLLDILAPKRSSLRAGLVEINMFLKINKHLIPMNPTKVVLLDKKMNLSWENNIPKRPIMALYDGAKKKKRKKKTLTMTMTILMSEEMLGVVDVTSVLLSFLLTTINWLCSTAVNVMKKNFCWQPLFMNTVPASPEMAIVVGSLTSNSFVKSLTSVSATIGIFTHGGMDTSCAECCGKPVTIASLELNISANATVAMQTLIWSVEDDHFLVKVHSHEDELPFLVIARSI
jgi:hypothetical protein